MYNGILYDRAICIFTIELELKIITCSQAIQLLLEFRQQSTRSEK